MRSPRWPGVALGWLGLLGLGLLFGLTVSQQPDHRFVQAALAMPAPDFAVRSLAGQPLSLSDLRGRPVLLTFWASWSDLCNAEAPMSEQLWQAYQTRGVVFVGLAAYDKEQNARAFVRRHRLTFPIAVDADDAVAGRYRLINIPERLFIDAEGRIIRRHVGPVDEASLRRYLDELLRGQS